MSETPVKQENNKPQRDAKGRLLPGNTANPNGRPAGRTLKEYMAEKFRTMSDEEKEVWLETHNIDGTTRWKMAEGNPSNDLKMGADDNLKEYLAKLNNLLG